MDSPLFEGIRGDAEEEAGRIKAQAEKRALEKRADLDSRLDALRREAKAERSRRLGDINRRLESDIKARRRRESLKMNEYYYNLVISRAQEILASYEGGAKPEGGADYPLVLAKWIAEGIIGLRADEAVALSSGGEELDPGILEKAAELAVGALGRKPVIRPGSRKLSEQGAAVFSADGRLSFFNTLSNRFRRYDGEIKTIIYRGLEQGSPEGGDLS
ncbi:MAG: hypothetical protein LBQ61_08310 [Spirochaetales bacterium]|jgi:vacuolar-type H+-ATPase subunit E/Vma4|nr:hypothetical protein [Spirochaetales bacterium]